MTRNGCCRVTSSRAPTGCFDVADGDRGANEDLHAQSVVRADDAEAARHLPPLAKTQILHQLACRSMREAAPRRASWGLADDSVKKLSPPPRTSGGPADALAALGAPLVLIVLITHSESSPNTSTVVAIVVVFLSSTSDPIDPAGGSGGGGAEGVRN